MSVASETHTHTHPKTWSRENELAFYSCRNTEITNLLIVRTNAHACYVCKSFIIIICCICGMAMNNSTEKERDREREKARKEKNMKYGKILCYKRHKSKQFSRCRSYLPKRKSLATCCYCLCCRDELRRWQSQQSKWNWKTPLFACVYVRDNEFPFQFWHLWWPFWFKWSSSSGSHHDLAIMRVHFSL